jgi:predicted dehydrogenase
VSVRVCVVGCGPIGNLHARLYAGMEGVELVGVCDIVEERARACGASVDVPWFTDAVAMFARVAGPGAGPVVASIATGGYEYGSDHFEPTLQALEAGCHVLCEKPICNDIGKAAAMVARARELKRCFGVDLNHRFTPAARLAKRWLDEGRLGSLLFANMALWIGKPRDEASPYFHMKALNPHSVDMLRHFCGGITHVQCFATKAPGRSLWSTASFNFRFASGAVGHLTSSYDIERGHPMERCEVAGTKGRFVVDDMWREATLYPAGNPVKSVFTNPVFGGYRDFDDTFRERLSCFVRQVADGVDPAAIDGSGADGLEAQRVIEAGIRSLESGRVVEVATVS